MKNQRSCSNSSFHRMSDMSANRAQQFSKEKYAENFFKALDALPDAIQQS